MNAPPRYATAMCRARDLLDELRIEDPRDIIIEQIAPFKRAPLRYAELVGCDGRMVRTGDLAVITVRSSLDRLGQRRLVIAHELGHVLLHPEIRQIDEVDSEQTRNFNHYQRPEELEANYFAAELLMPSKFYRADAAVREPSWDSITALAQKYQTTRSAAAVQYVHCSKEPVILVASERGDRKWFVFGESAKDFNLAEDTRIHKYSCAKEVLLTTKTRSRASDVAAGAWLDGFDPDGNCFLTEDSMRANGSDFVLTLIWIDKVI